MFTYLGWYNEKGVATQLYDVRLWGAWDNSVVYTELVDTEFDVYQGRVYVAEIRGVEWVALAEKSVRAGRQPGP